jgi:hypothetical protein
MDEHQRPGRTKFRFTPHEDDILTCLVLRHGVSSWLTIAARMPGRNARQCRDRWNHYLAATCAGRPSLLDDLRPLTELALRGRTWPGFKGQDVLFRPVPREPTTQAPPMPRVVFPLLHPPEGGHFVDAQIVNAESALP